jgi:hypothetical protein
MSKRLLLAVLAAALVSMIAVAAIPGSAPASPAAPGAWLIVAIWLGSMVAFLAVLAGVVMALSQPDSTGTTGGTSLPADQPRRAA